ncbi:hypothetical protein ACJJTC_002702 [Scirpophaga incertulas]
MDASVDARGFRKATLTLGVTPDTPLHSECHQLTSFRLCLVERRGPYKRTAKYCPALDNSTSGIECVVGADRLDCLRRISKGTVDFGVFDPEDLVAAQWANIDVLVTNEMRSRFKHPFERSIVAVVNRRILPSEPSSIHNILKNSTLCHPGMGLDDVIRPLSETLSKYMESLVIPRQCDPELSMAENRIKALSEYFGDSCNAGPWILDAHRDAELKSRYPSLCKACGSSKCNIFDRYWGDAGSLSCVVERGDITWAEVDDVKAYFGIGISPKKGVTYPDPESFAWICRDGTWRSLNEEPCVWLHRPWPVIVAKSKASAAVAAIAEGLAEITMTDPYWKRALANLLEVHQAQSHRLQPPQVAMDYLGKAKGFREAYSQSGCDPPRHITMCTTSTLERNKCEWLSEAAETGEVVVQANSDWLLKGMRDYALTPLLHEATPIVDQTDTVVAYVKKDSGINKMADMRGKRVSFPEYDGLAWHSVLRYINKKEGVNCNDMKAYFGEICAPGFEKANASLATIDKMTGSCYKNDGKVLSGEIQALQALVEGKTDVAFISIQTYNLYAGQKLPMYAWAKNPIHIVPVCPEENVKYCFISWSNLGHIFAAKNITTMRKQEIINVFTKLDKLFGKQYPFHLPMFSMYGPFNHKMDVLFHNNTRVLATEDLLRNHPYDKIPLNFERSLSNSTDSCKLVDFNLGVKIEPSLIALFSLVAYLLSR